jgi:transcriptional regulator with XRE-family HTH domain
MAVEFLSQPSPAAVVTKATERAAELLGLSGRELAAVLGVSASSWSRTLAGRRTIDPASKEGELALLFLRVFRSLDALLGGDAGKCRRWLRAHNDHLAGVPAALLQTTPGLVRVADYLDALRGQG